MTVSGASFPWPPASATGVGSYPGDDVREALRVVLGELPDLPHLPELPHRGPAAGLLGRTSALLVDLPVELQPSGWRVGARPGHDLTAARDTLAGDLDALEELAGAHTGAIKVQAAGPWTLAAEIELPHGDKVLADSGALRDLVASLAEGLANHARDLRRRVLGAPIVLQLDEPALLRVLAGRVPSASGLRVLQAVDETAATEGLRGVIEAVSAAGAFPVVHCCAQAPPVGLLHQAGARAVSVDAGRLSTSSDDALGAAVEAGVGLFLGVVPGAVPGPETEPPAAEDLAESARGLWRRLGFRREEVSATVVLTPACGLAGASASYARKAIARCREAAGVLEVEPG